MEIPKYIVFRVDVMRKGTSVELTNITDDVEDVILKAKPTVSKMEQVQTEPQADYLVKSPQKSRDSHEIDQTDCPWK